MKREKTASHSSAVFSISVRQFFRAASSTLCVKLLSTAPTPARAASTQAMRSGACLMSMVVSTRHFSSSWHATAASTSGLAARRPGPSASLLSRASRLATTASLVAFSTRLITASTIYPYISLGLSASTACTSATSCCSRNSPTQESARFSIFLSLKVKGGPLLPEPEFCASLCTLRRVCPASGRLSLPLPPALRLLLPPS
mmetsp:Transcript_21408/g.47538  ORF Transcript_21408/g.47538 Transcript_21408/m.47538 type:complete len:201 (-) Transcript_21408:38-640(-)